MRNQTTNRLPLKLTTAALALALILAAGPAMADSSYTVWLVVFNEPDLCLGGPGTCGVDDFVFDSPARVAIAHLAGGRVQKNGKAALAAGYGTGSTINTLVNFKDTPNVIENPAKAEFHIVTRTHSKFNSGVADPQGAGGPPDWFLEITNFGGGCGDGAVEGDVDYCIDNQFAIFEGGRGLRTQSRPLFDFDGPTKIPGGRVILTRAADGIIVGLKTRLPSYP